MKINALADVGEQIASDLLEHHGIKGMKWGRRKDTTSHPHSEDAAKASEYSKRAKTAGTHSLSNKKLKHLVDRMDLEKRYSKFSELDRAKVKRGAKFAASKLYKIAEEQAEEFARYYVNDKLAKALIKAYY